MLKNKTIWLICINAQPPKIDTHLRHLKLADYLISKGYNVIIIAGSYLHYNKTNLINDSSKFLYKEFDKKKYYFINVNSYTSNGLNRIISIFKFGFKLFKYRNLFEKPDIIIHNLRVPFDFLVYFAAKKLKAKYITEVWDLWPESFVAVGLMSKNSLFVKLAYAVEKWLYTKADRIVFTMEGAKDYIKEKRWDKNSGGTIDMAKYVYINNGVDILDFDYNKENYIIEDEDLLDCSIFKVIYIGSIRLANNLKLLIDAAKLLQTEPNLKLFIYGDGDEREELIRYCAENNINNVVFKQKWVEIKYIPYILSRSSLNILNYKKNAIQRFGSSQGKLFQYFASGKPICSNQNLGYDPVKRYRAGVSECFESPREYADAILKFYAIFNTNEYNILCENARKAASDFDYNKLSEEYYNVINGL